MAEADQLPPQAGILHRYAGKRVAFEHSPPAHVSAPALHTLLFIPGLLDGLLTVTYSTALAHALPPSWRLVQPLLSSSYTGFGTSSLSRDVREIAQCLVYIATLRRRSTPGKVVLMGHSTGSQDVLHFLVSARQEGEPPRPAVQGAILQASVSDRESLCAQWMPEAYEAGVALAASWMAEGRGADVLPRAVTEATFGAPVTAARFLSLASPPPEHAGEDDYFSSDLGEERLRETFGKIGEGVRLQILFGGKDQYVPPTVDKRALVERWVKIAREGGTVVDEDTGIIDGADHDLSQAGEEVVQEVIGRVVRFLQRIEST